MSEYYLLLKTATPEFRAWRNLDPRFKNRISVIVELTRGRKNFGLDKNLKREDLLRMEGVYGFDKILEQFQSEFSKCAQVTLDLTRESSLLCFEINALANPDGGYRTWVDFVRQQKRCIHGIVPTILVNPRADDTAEQYAADLASQFEAFAGDYDEIAYRASAFFDPEFETDLWVLSDRISDYIKAGKRFRIELDHEFVRPSSGVLHAPRSAKLVERLHATYPVSEIVVLASSFPKDVDEFGEGDCAALRQEEVMLFEEISRLASGHPPLVYGDYGSINPVRKIESPGGWRPRIDFPTSRTETYYISDMEEDQIFVRGRRAVYRSYAERYGSVARSVANDDRFEELTDSWGVKQILKAANGQEARGFPSFWTSVRMEIHIIQQLRRLGLA